MARGEQRRGGSSSEGSELIERLVMVNRVAKVAKGGKRYAFAALVVVGDGRGYAGFGSARAREVPEAVTKATRQAQRRMTRVALREGRTLHHDIVGRYGAGIVHMRSAPSGTGVIAGGSTRAVFEVLGVKDIVAKSLGSNNPHNLVRATFQGLTACRSPRAVAQRRGLRVPDLLQRRALINETYGRYAKGRRLVAESVSSEGEDTGEALAGDVPATEKDS